MSVSEVGSSVVESYYIECGRHCFVCIGGRMD